MPGRCIVIVTEQIVLIISLLAGLAVLFFGRRLFWLFVAVVGFIVGFELASDFLAGQSEWLIFLIYLLVGLAAAAIAVFLQYLALGIAGFLAGGYLVIALWGTAELGGPDWLVWVVALVGAIIGAVLVVAMFDWALVILTSLVGAAMIAQIPADWPLLWRTVLFVVLLVLGLGVQSAMLAREGTTTVRRRRVIVRRSGEERPAG